MVLELSRSTPATCRRQPGGLPVVSDPSTSNQHRPVDEAIHHGPWPSAAAWASRWTQAVCGSPG